MRVGSRLTPRQFASISLAQLAPKSPAASSNFIVSADAEDQAAARRIDNINRMAFITSSHMKSVPVVKPLRKESCKMPQPPPSPPLQASAAAYNPWIRPASISSRLKRRDSAPPLQ